MTLRRVIRYPLNILLVQKFSAIFVADDEANRKAGSGER
jgi:hypothetical protein